MEALANSHLEQNLCMVIHKTQVAVLAITQKYMWQENRFLERSSYSSLGIEVLCHKEVNQ